MAKNSPFIFYSTLSTVFVGPLLAGVLIDLLLGTKPLFILLGLLLGMVFLVTYLIRISKDS